MPRQYAFKDKCLVNNSDQVLGQAGKNIIPEQEKQSLWKSFLEKFTDPLIVILLVVLVLSVGISAYEMVFLGRSLSCLIEPLGIFIAIMLATGIAFLLEVNAEKAFRILNRKKDERPVKVLRWKTEADRRDGRKRPSIFQVKRCDVVIGDIVRLESGDEVPADGFLLEAANLRVDESNFTGEPFTSKYVDPEMEPGEPTYPANFLLRGTVLLEGSAIYQVSATGPDTEEGKGAQTLREEEDVQTPLNAQLKQFARGISIASYIIAALIRQPKLVILDEPFNFLDPTSQSILKRMLTDYNKQTGATILLSSHNLQHTIDISTRIVLLEKGHVISDIVNDSDEARQHLVDYFEEKV